MKIKISISLVVVFLSFFSGLVAQNNEWFINTQFGITRVEIENKSITNAFTQRIKAGKNFALKNNWYLSVGVGHQNISFLVPGKDDFLTLVAVSVPTNLGYAFPINNKVSLNLEAGLYGNFYYNSITRNEKRDTDDESNPKAQSIGFGSFVGARYKLNEKFAFQGGLRTQGDIIAFSEENEIKLTNNYLFGIGFLFNFK